MINDCRQSLSDDHDDDKTIIMIMVILSFSDLLIKFCALIVVLNVRTFEALESFISCHGFEWDTENCDLSISSAKLVGAQDMHSVTIFSAHS